MEMQESRQPAKFRIRDRRRRFQPETGALFKKGKQYIHRKRRPVPGEPEDGALEFHFVAGLALGKAASSLWQALVAGTVACFLEGIFSSCMAARLPRSAKAANSSCG